tara:strand:- start:535 stop:762 length:228 start_codon:yes stop_codon:yes gene_type:complete
MEKQMTFTRDEMNAVVRWLEDRRTWLQGERLVIECGDDFAHSNGKWPRVQELQREEFALTASLQTAKEQLGQADA